jgi:nucleotide-binding universal stress UspA family protein
LLDRERYAHVLFATDFSDGSMHALPYALSLAEENDAELTLMHVLEQLEPLPMEYSNELLANYRQRLWQIVPEEASLWCKPQVTVAVGNAAEEIGRTARDRQVELIIMGVHAAGVVANHLPWTVVHSVVRHARCPVLTVRGGAST